MDGAALDGGGEHGPERGKVSDRAVEPPRDGGPGPSFGISVAVIGAGLLWLVLAGLYLYFRA